MDRPSQPSPAPRVSAPPGPHPDGAEGLKGEGTGGITHCSPISAAQSGEQTPTPSSRCFLSLSPVFPVWGTGRSRKHSGVTQWGLGMLWV